MVSEDLKEELFLHDWKMMKLKRCLVDVTGSSTYRFPNGIMVRCYATYCKIRVSVEGAPLIESILKSWIFEKKTNRKKEEGIEFKIDDGWGLQNKRRGDYFDLLWELYSLEGNWETEPINYWRW
jgi:hypothetical protein